MLGTYEGLGEILEDSLLLEVLAELLALGIQGARLGGHGDVGRGDGEVGKRGRFARFAERETFPVRFALRIELRIRFSFFFFPACFALKPRATRVS